jgi:hypothetical protein
MATETKQPIPHELSANTRSIRLYSADDSELIALHSITKKMNRKMDIVDLIRDCIQAGLPVVKERWEPIVSKANKESK